MTEQLSLLDWRPPAEILPFPFHRSHGATIGFARSIVNLETAKRSGRLNSLRAQTRKHLEPLVGYDEADAAADELVRAIKVGFAYCENFPSSKQRTAPAVILSLSGQRIQKSPHSDGDGAARAQGQGSKTLAGLGGAHNAAEYDAARAHDGGVR